MTGTVYRPEDLRKLLVSPHATLPGHYLFEGFVSAEEEAELVQMIDAVQPAWNNSNFNGPHRQGDPGIPTAVCPLCPECC